MKLNTFKMVVGEREGDFYSGGVDQCWPCSSKWGSILGLRVGAKFKSTFEVKQSLQIFQEKQFCQIYQHEQLSLGNNSR